MTDAASTPLLVEDDDATRTFLADNLTADGYDLLVADTVRDGTRLLETKFPDLAVVDVGLPDGSGLELVRRVRDADGLVSRVDPLTPLLVLSGRASDVDRLRGLERGADDFVAKPTASMFGPMARGSRRRIGCQASSTPATTSGRAQGMTTHLSASTAAPPHSPRARAMASSCWASRSRASAGTSSVSVVAWATV